MYEAAVWLVRQPPRPGTQGKRATQSGSTPVLPDAINPPPQIHIDGEGMRDPPEPRQSPAQLSGWNDGPPYYNLRVRYTHAPSCPRRLRALRSPARRPPETTPRLPQPDFPGRLRVPEWYVRDPTELQGVIPGSAEIASAREPRKGTLPLCASEDAPGRWVYTNSHYPDVRRPRPRLVCAAAVASSSPHRCVR